MRGQSFRHMPVDPADYMMEQSQNIIHPFSVGRHIQLKHIESVIKIRAETPILKALQ